MGSFFVILGWLCVFMAFEVLMPVRAIMICSAITFFIIGFRCWSIDDDEEIKRIESERGFKKIWGKK